jgi:hypothetical protein
LVIGLTAERVVVGRPLHQVAAVEHDHPAAKGALTLQEQGARRRAPHAPFGICGEGIELGVDIIGMKDDQGISAGAVGGTRSRAPRTQPRGQPRGQEEDRGADKETLDTTWFQY